MPPKSKKASQTGTPHGNLLSLIKDGGSVQPEIQTIIEKATEDEKEAVAVLVNFVICSCGMNETVEGWQIGHDDAKGVLTKLSEKIQSHVSEKYPLASREKKWEKFKFNYQNFWRQLMKGLEKDGLLYTSSFADTLIKWVGGLSTSKVRAFRHHAAVAIYCMMTAASKLAASLIGLGAKLADKGGKKSVQSAQADVSKKLKRMKELLETSFDISCLSRHKDVVPEIRALSISFQHEWTVAYPELFVADDFTKILGWTLSDKDEAVRCNTLKGLQDIFSAKSAFSKMSAWLTKFISRIVEMTLDLSPSVSIEALKLVTIFLESEATHRKDLFSENVQDGFIEFIYDERASVRQAAARVFHLVMMNRVKGKLPKKPSQAATSKAYLTQIIDWMSTQTVELVPSCVVEALTNVEAYTSGFTAPVFTEFKVLVDIIEDDEAEDGAVHAALRLLLAVVRKAHGKLDLSFPITQDRLHTIPKTKRVKLDKAWTDPKGSILVSLNEALPSFLPATLVKRQTDEISVQLLGQVVQVTDPAVWSTGGKQTEKLFDELLAIMEKLYTTRIQEETIDSLAIAWRQLTMKEHPLRDPARLVWSNVAAKVCKLTGSSKASVKRQWLRLAAALEANLDIVDQAWEKILAAFEKEGTPAAAHCCEVIAAAMAGLLIHTHRVHKKLDEGINLKEDMEAVSNFFCNCIDPNTEVENEVRAAAFRGLTNTWTLGCGLELLPKPDDAMQQNFALAFDTIVPDFPSKGTRTVARHITIERDTLSHVMCMVKVIMQEYIDEKWAASVFVKWPNLPQKAQEEVKELHSSFDRRVRQLEVQAIMLANHKYYQAKEDDIEAAEGVIKSLCTKLAAQNGGVGKKSDTTGQVFNLLDVLEANAAEDDKNHFVLYAATPFVRFLKMSEVKTLLAKMEERGYDMKNQPIVAFMNTLKRRAGEALIEEPKEKAKQAKKPEAKGGKETVSKDTGVKAGRSTESSVPSTRKRTAQKLYYDDEEEEDEQPVKSVSKATPGSKKKKGTPSLPEAGSSVVSHLDYSMTFDDTPEKKSMSQKSTDNAYSMTFSSLGSQDGAPEAPHISQSSSSSRKSGKRTAQTTTNSEIFPNSSDQSESYIFAASDSDEEEEDEQPSPKRPKISTIRNPLRQRK